MIEFELKEAYIELYKLIKTLDLVDSGAQAKQIIAAGFVYRNGDIELRKRAKITKGETIRIENVTIIVI